MSGDSADGAPLLWVDLEMTGLDPVEDRILEVAAVATGWDLVEVARYEAVKKVGPALMRRRMVGDFWNEHADTRDALQAQNASGKSGRTVENELLEFVAEHCRERPILAGNSIHQDRRFIANEWRRLDAALHYRMLDVTAWKLVFEHRFGIDFEKSEAHRAVDDILESIAELRFYLDRIDPTPSG